MTLCKSLLPSERKIVRRITKVRKTADVVSRSKRRFREYRYLRSVLRAYRYLADNKLLSALMEIAPAVLMAPVRASWHPLRVLIEATMWTEIDYRTRSRWTRALEFAAAKQIEPDQLAQFFRANNGIAGCADLASKTASKTRRTKLIPIRSSTPLPLLAFPPVGVQNKCHSARPLNQRVADFRQSSLVDPSSR